MIWWFICPKPYFSNICPSNHKFEPMIFLNGTWHDFKQNCAFILLKHGFLGCFLTIYCPIWYSASSIIQFGHKITIKYQWTKPISHDMTIIHVIKPLAWRKMSNFVILTSFGDFCATNQNSVLDQIGHFLTRVCTNLTVQCQ